MIQAESVLSKIAGVFVLGPPCSGKTTATGHLKRLFVGSGAHGELRVRIMDDFSVIAEMYRRSTPGEDPRFAPSEGTFIIKDPGVYAEALDRINRQLLEVGEPQVSIVEFSRVSYRDSIHRFNEEVLARSVALYISCPFADCERRNCRRGHGGVDESRDHRVPDPVMRKYAEGDQLADIDFLASQPFGGIHHIKNEGNFEQFVGAIEDCFSKMVMSSTARPEGSGPRE